MFSFHDDVSSLNERAHLYVNNESNKQNKVERGRCGQKGERERARASKRERRKSQTQKLPSSSFFPLPNTNRTRRNATGCLHVRIELKYVDGWPGSRAERKENRRLTTPSNKQEKWPSPSSSSCIDRAGADEREKIVSACIYGLKLRQQEEREREEKKKEAEGEKAVPILTPSSE